jgi:hypothetical protein
MHRILLISLLVAMPASLSAQRGGFGHFSGHSSGRFASNSNRGAYGRASAYAVPFLDPLYSDFVGAPDYSEVLGQPVVYRPAVADTRPPAQPLLIELQGDRYVQISGDEVFHAQMIDQIPTDRLPNTSASESSAATPQTQHAPTVLVFRDGHRQEISDYTITNGVLYASADYYSSGSWNQKIELASLDLRETLNVNQSRGNQFRVPSAANEVIVGP